MVERLVAGIRRPEWPRAFQEDFAGGALDQLEAYLHEFRVD